MTTTANQTTTLIGSEKQIAWAEDLRRRFSLMWDQAGDTLVGKIGAEAQDIHDAMMACTSAKNWIDAGTYIPKQFTQTPNQMVSDLAGILRDWKRMEAAK